MGVTGNFKEFFDSVQQEYKKFKVDKKEICIIAVVQALSDLQVMSPVDFGRYRAGHILTINMPSNYVPPEVRPDEKRKRNKIKSASPSSDLTAKMTENMQSAVSVLNNASIEEAVRLIIYITNNVDYAAFIEDGSYTKDQKAPRALYAKTRDKTEQRINAEINRRAFER